MRGKKGKRKVRNEKERREEQVKNEEGGLQKQEGRKGNKKEKKRI